MPGMVFSNNSCSFCPPGRSSSNFNSTSCPVICQVGHYSGSSDLWCNKCTFGSFTNVSEASNCTLCPKGTYASFQGQSSCFLCPSPYFVNYEGATSIDQCQDCIKGYVKSSNSSGCNACASGTYNVEDQCLPCTRGKFSSLPAQTFCQNCPYGKWSNLTGITDSNTCKQCPTQGAKCEEGSQWPFVLSGWFRNLTESADTIVLCVPQEACLEAGNSTTPCAVGYEGRACTNCATGYFRLGTRCRFCLPAAARWLIVMFLIGIVIYIFWRLSLVENRIPFSAKITLQWLQFLGVYGTLSEKWPQSLKNIFSAVNFLNVDAQYFGFNCDKIFNYWVIWSLKVLSPLILFGSIFCVVYIKLRTSKRLTHSMALDEFKTKLSSFCLTLTLLSTLVFSSLFEVFNCVQQSQNSYVLQADPSVLCYSDKWKSFTVFSGFFIAIYVVILPGIGIFMIWKLKSKDRISLDRIMGPFVSPYRVGCEHWEFVRLFEKVVFFIIRYAMSFDRSFKVAILLCTLMIWMIVDIHVMPFNELRIHQHSLR
jgi:hypothetical protein